jgi:superfamily II helicase
MSEQPDTQADLTGPHDAAQEVDQEKQQAEEAEVEELNKAIDVSQDLISWSRTPAGKDTIDRLQNESRKAMNELFAVLHDSPELGKLVSVIARFEASVQMLRRFIGADEDLDILLNELARKRPSASADLAK